MGHTKLCTFKVNVNVSSGNKYTYGAMSLKDVKGLILSEQEYQTPKGHRVVNAEIWPQTAAGKRLVKKDFAIMSNDFFIDHYNVGDKVPMYCF